MTTKRTFPAWLPGAVISLLLMTALLLRVDSRASWEALRRADHFYLALALLGSLLWMSWRALVWRSLLPQPIPWRTVFPVLNEGYFLNMVLPFRLGELGRVYLLAQRTGLDFVTVLPTVFVERAFDLLFSAAFLLFSLGLVVLDARTQSLAWLVSGVVALGLALLYGLMRWRADWRPWLDARLPDGAVRARLLPLLDGLLDGLGILQDGRRFLLFAVLMTLNWALAVLQFWLILRAFFPSAQMAWALFVLAAAAFGGAIPSLPGAIGTLEAAIGGAVFLLTGDQNTALTVGLAVRLYNYAVPVPVGIWALTREGQTLMGLYHTLRRLTTGKHYDSAS